MKNTTILISIICITIFLVGCKNKENILITEYESAEPDKAVSHSIKEEKEEDNDNTEKNTNSDVKAQNENPKIISHNTPSKFKTDDDTLSIDNHDIDSGITTSTKPIMIAMMGPMNGKDSIIGNSMIDGGHMGLIDLFNKYKIPVRLTTIDTGNNIEDMECNISKLDESEFDIIVKFLSESQEKFADMYIEHQPNKPNIITFNPNSKNTTSCAISPNTQFKAILQHISKNNAQKKSIVFLVLPTLEDEKNWIGKTQYNNHIDLEVLKYTNHDVQQTTDDIQKIIQTINQKSFTKQEQIDPASIPNVFIIFTEGNWKLQKLMTQMDNIKNIQSKVILASLSNKSGKIESNAEKRHKFGNILTTAPSTSQYGSFMAAFKNEYHRKPLELSFWSYNMITSLKDAKFIGEKWQFSDNFCNIEVTVK
jgi:hypothetical protein